MNTNVENAKYISSNFLEFRYHSVSSSGKMPKLQFFDFVSILCLFIFSLLLKEHIKLKIEIEIEIKSLNITKYANQSILFYNRVPKTGSKNLEVLLGHLAEENGFRKYYDIHRGSGKYEVTKMTLTEKLAHIQLCDANKDNITIPFSITKHTNFLDFEEFNRTNPIYINIVRNPVERVISWYYYIR